MMEDSGAVISVPDSVPDCNVRVIVVTAGDMEELGTKPINEDGFEAEGCDGDAKGVDGEKTGKEGGGENEDPDETATNDDRENKDDDGESGGDGGQTKDNDGEDKDRNEYGRAEDIENCEDGDSPLLVEIDSGKETKDDDGDKDGNESSIVLKLLLDSSQMRCLLKNDGTTIDEMLTISGAQIRILPRDDLPPCALPSDAVVEIYRESGVLRRGLELVAQQIVENSFPFLDAHVQSSGPSSQVGSVIGKGGTGIISIKQETGSEITIMDGVPDSEERAIVVSGPAVLYTFLHPEDRVSPIQDALVRVYKRILGANANSNEGSVLARILVSSNQIGCPWNQPAIITNTTVEVLVPRSVVPAIKGAAGGCLKQIRQFSDARITIRESKPWEKDTAIIISGTPEQTQAAQSLIQAFVMIEQETNQS
ncbi:hypothetical protein MLD38_022381 [Melastoma candidum]|uniref:Uncharacterized protein n=1 Tax=Melastoma candidum TaxID=119954 RepID=A0ACB9QJ84_9MYRT|nr:hypothetical protein MLD38_022381 [Melastoma candidum]